MSVADELKKIDQLRESGALSEEEFSRAKAKVLDYSGDAGGYEKAAENSSDIDKAGADTNRLACILHFSQLLGLLIPIAGFLAPPIIWAIYNKQHPALTAHFKNVINWVLSVIIYLIVCGLLFATFLAAIGILGLFVLILLGVVFPIAAGMKANTGEVWRYPLSIQFLKQNINKSEY